MKDTAKEYYNYSLAVLDITNESLAEKVNKSLDVIGVKDFKFGVMGKV